MVVAVLTSRFPLPLNRGDRVRIYHQIKHLAKNHQVHLFCTAKEPVNTDDLAHLQSFCKSVTIYRLTYWGIFWGVVRALFTGQSLQSGYFYRRYIAAHLHQKLNNLKPDAIYCQLVRMATYLKDFSHPNKTLDYMDTLSADMQRRSGLKNRFRGFVFGVEYERIKKLETDSYHWFAKHCIISAQDLALLPLADKSKVAIIPNGIETDIEVNEPKQFDILFLGNLSYDSNIVSAQYLVNQVMPLVWAINPNVTVNLTGANPTSQVLALQSPKVSVHGWVENKWLTYAQACLFVAPMLISVGLQNKILEAMTVGIPTITTPMANNALGGTHNQNIVLANSPQAFADAIIALLNNPQQAETIGSAGKTFVQTHYSWQSKNQQLEGLLAG